MKRTLDIIKAHLDRHPHSAVMFSGGVDSLVLLDLVFARAGARLPVIFVDSGMEHPQTLPFVEQTCERYGAELHVVTPQRAPLEQWSRQGWPMLGKLAAANWNRKHKGRNMGFRLGVSACCRNLKIAPGREALKSIGATAQLTGQRGGADDICRGLRAHKDGHTYFVKADRVTICNPLQNWTSSMIRRYVQQNVLPLHPAIAQGAKTIGCLYCGGGAQYSDSGFRWLRLNLPDHWRRFIVDWRAGLVILAIKFDVRLDRVAQATERLGGLLEVARTTGPAFDFLRLPGPLQSRYERKIPHVFTTATV